MNAVKLPHKHGSACQRLQPRRQQPRLSCAAAINSSSTAPMTVSLADIQPIQCLKEWAVTCAALGAGKQTILLRKGGIREPTFTPKASHFLLFPTAFHTDAQLLKPGVAKQFHQEMVLQPKEVPQLPLQYFAEITGAWTTKDPSVLQGLDDLHVYTNAFLDTRLKWRAKEPLTLLELRCYTLQQPLLIPVKEREEYFGCFSWVELQQADVAAGQLANEQHGQWQVQAALDDEEFMGKQKILRAGLKQLQAVELDAV